MKKELIFGLLIVFVVGGGLFFMINSNKEDKKEEIKINEVVNPVATKKVEQRTQKKSSFSLSDVAEHNNENDCWLVIDGKVYDVTSYIEKHPGGGVIANYCGQEATEAFNTKGGKGFPHKPVARDILKDFYIGDLAEE